MYMQKSLALLDYNEFPIFFFPCCQHSKIKTHSHDHHDHFMHQCSATHTRDDHFGIHQFSAPLYIMRWRRKREKIILEIEIGMKCHK